MHRSDLLRRLSRYEPDNGTESQFKKDLRAFVEKYVDCFERSLKVGHITGSAWIVDNSLSQALLTHHNKLDRWLQLGGHADGETDIIKAATKEAVEESGLQSLQLRSEEIFDIDIHLIPARGNDPEHLHYDIRFLFLADHKEKLHVSSESKTLSWVPFERLSELTQANKSILRMSEKTKKIRSHNLWDLYQP